MTDCAIRWRPSGGRGEYEFVPAGALENREIVIAIDALNVIVIAEVRAIQAQGKPRLRKFEANDRSKLHLPPLVIATARLPQPRREDILHEVTFPLENKNYVVDEIEFEIAEDNGQVITLVPLCLKILNSNFVIDLQDRYNALARDLARLDDIRKSSPLLSDAIASHLDLVRAGKNTVEIQQAADAVMELQRDKFGPTNYGSISSIIDATAMPYSPTEAEIYGIEGKTLTRIHAFKERDRSLSAKAKKHYRIAWGELHCEACGLKPSRKYGDRGDHCIEAHHKTPVEQLLPDSITRVSDLAMLCASCHRIVHSGQPMLHIDQVIVN